MRYIRLIANTVLYLLIAAIVAVFVLSRAVPFITGTQTISIDGRSMEPTIPLGSLAFIEPVDTPKLGDVVTFAGEAGLTTHRVIASWDGNGKTWLTQGDANDAPDAMPVPTDAILGEVHMWIPFLGIVTSVLTTLPAMAFVVLLAVTILYALPRPKAADSLKVSRRSRSLVDLTDAG